MTASHGITRSCVVCNHENGDVDIRRGGAEDLEEVVDLWRREGGPTSLAAGVAEAAALLTRDQDALLIARGDGQVVGTVIVGWDGWRCHLYRLVVEPRGLPARCARGSLVTPLAT